MVGISKAGLKGIAILTVTIMALTFGSRASTGILIPILLVGDVLAVWYYNRHAQWKLLFRLVPAMAIGIVIGAFLGKDLPETTFKQAMAGIILLSVVMMYLWDRRKDFRIPDTSYFAWGMGIAAGLATMIGNLAGSFTNLFFLGMRTPKNNFIGTAAWLFLITNTFKLPFHIFLWETIDASTLAIDLRLLPGIFFGFFVGVKVIRHVSEKNYRRVILFLTALGAILILAR